MGQPKEWVLDSLPLSQINLLVGKNATGKTRTLSVIASLAKLLSSNPRYMITHGTFDVVFDDDGVRLRYKLSIEGNNVINEEYFIGDKRVLYRGPDGEGEIETHTAENGPQMVRFSPPKNELAAVIRRDSLQHPYFERLHMWSQATRHFTFGTPLGKDHLAMIIKGGPEADDRDTNQAVGIFRKAYRELGAPFIDAVKMDMARIGYEIDGIEVVAPENITLVPSSSNMPDIPELSCIGIREEGLNRVIDQTEISQGMFRALSVLIQVNYSQMAQRANCILIDDIGEGLDFERSTKLINVLRQKASESSFQLIMTTNDRFVMNNVPLTEWLVLQRQGGKLKVRNYENSKVLFDDFRFTGLSNFSLLETDFLNDNGSAETAGA
jgi:energy-coupling factor transporter ATP-binding protein EcfA2